MPAIPGSFDQVLAGVDKKERIPFDLAGMFDFNGPRNPKVIINPLTGQPAHLSDGYGW